MPQRNDPCPCGSGKKYKKCCGTGSAGRQGLDIIAVNRAVAYEGEIGRARKEYCEAYTDFKKKGIAEVEAKLTQGVAKMGKSITCRKGCGHCCDVYVFADLQECEAIVYHLYGHNDALEHFLRQYPRWKERIDHLGRTLPRIDSAQRRALMGNATEEDRRAFDENLTLYSKQRLPCPFLNDNTCTIYEVRPYVCAGVVSTSPPECCSPDSPEHEKNMLIKADFQPQNDLPYFIKTTNAINFGCMPELVHRIIERGYAFLSTISGLEDMRRFAVGDSEVRSILARMGTPGK